MISTRNLSKNFAAFSAVRKVNLEVPQGAVYGFLGANGAGKTTTLKMLMGLLVPSVGEALIGNLDCHKDRLALKRVVGYLPDVPQFPSFLQGREILQMAAELHGQNTRDAKRRAAELLAWIGLDMMAGEFADNYSIGLKKRLGLACAIVHDPAVLLLDEPSNGLDPYATRLIRNWIGEMAQKGKTIVLSTHRLDFAEHVCSHLGILHRGELVVQGELQAIRQQRATGAHLEDIFFALTGAEDAHAIDS